VLDTQDKENENIDDRDDEQPKTHAKGTRKMKVSNNALILENVQRHQKNLTFSQEMLPLTTSRNYRCGGTNCPSDHCYIPSDGPHFMLGHEHFEKWAAALVSCFPVLCVLYTPPHTPVGLYLESRWIPGVQMESTWNTTKSVYFWIILLESMWSLHRLHLDSTQIQLNLNKEVFKIETSRLK